MTPRRVQPLLSPPGWRCRESRGCALARSRGAVCVCRVTAKECEAVTSPSWPWKKKFRPPSAPRPWNFSPARSWSARKCPAPPPVFRPRSPQSLSFFRRLYTHAQLSQCNSSSVKTRARNLQEILKKMDPNTDLINELRASAESENVIAWCAPISAAGFFPPPPPHASPHPSTFASYHTTPELSA